jgi:hypothetical protein
LLQNDFMRSELCVDGLRGKVTDFLKAEGLEDRHFSEKTHQLLVKLLLRSSNDVLEVLSLDHKEIRPLLCNGCMKEQIKLNMLLNCTLLVKALAC